MVHKTRGIVFRFTKFRETSIIVTIFTELFGLQSYMVNGVRSKSSKSRIALYQPLTLLNLVVYHRENANIERIKEVSCLHPYRTLTTDVKKSTIALFLAEILNKTIKHESHAGEMFEFLSSSLIAMDRLEETCENFHLVFLIRLCRHLGFGVETPEQLLSGTPADAAITELLARLITMDYDQPLPMSNAQRRTILGCILRFYAEHIDMGEIKSVQVLREVLM